MPSGQKSRLRIGDLRVDPTLDEIRKNGVTIKLEPRAMRLLMCLADHAGEVVSVDDLLDVVWKDVVVSQDSVYAAVAALRRILGDDPKNPTYIANVVRRGYRLIAAVSPLEVAAPTPAPPPPVPPPPVPGKPSIAVMPFANLTGDADQGYFVDGLMEEIVGALTRIRTLFVIGSGSSQSFKGQDISAVDAATKLGVRYVLEGSVRKAGKRIRIAVKLIDSSTREQIWAERFEGMLSQVFKLQDDVALGVAGVIEFSVQNAETLRSYMRPTPDLKSYDLYLRALVPFRGYTRQGILEAKALLERAIELDENYALALSLLASCHAVIRQYQWTDEPMTHAREAMQLIQRSLRSGSDDPQVLGTASLAFWMAGEVATAAQLAKRAVTLNPGSSFPLLVRGQICISTDELAIAEDVLQRSLRLDPLSPNRNLQLGAMAALRFAQRRFGEAAGFSREASQLSASPASLGFLAAASGQLRDLDTARDALLKLRAVTAMTPLELAGLFYRNPQYRNAFMEGIAFAEEKERDAERDAQHEADIP